MSSYPPDLADKVRSVWPSIQPYVRAFDPGINVSALPDDEALRSLLSIAFQSSLLSEEGRDICFAVVVASAAEVKSHDPDAQIVVFPKPLPLHPAQIAKLAPAIHPSTSMIGVSVDDSSRLEVWGIIHTGALYWNHVHGRWTPSDIIGSDPPWCLRVSAFRRGQVIVSCGMFDCVVLEEGGIYRPGGPIVEETASPIANFFIDGRRALVDAVRKRGQGWDYDFLIRQAYDKALIRLLVQVQQRGHGGAFIFFKEPTMASNLGALLNTKFRVNITWPWERFVDAMAVKEDDKTSGQTLDCLDRFHDAIDFVAGLTALDGAVVVSDHFRVTGFGVEILTDKPGNESVLVRKWGEPETEEEVPVNRYGTRHRSAFRLCEESTDCIVFVFSQDGPVRSVFNDGSRVVVWDRANPGFSGM
jgi:hypothetical protein